MNLEDFIEENSISNLDWLNDEETYIPKDKDIDKKDDLEIEWGEGSGIDIGYQPEPTTIKDEMDLSNNYMQRTVREMQMMGMNQNKIVSCLIERFGKSLVKKNMSNMKLLLANSGFTGCVALDTKDYNQCKDGIKVASKSPYKRYIKFAIANEGCADCMFFRRGRSIKATREVSENSLDSFLIPEEIVEQENRPVCVSLGLPLIFSQAGITEDDANDVVNKLADEKEISRKDADSIISSNLVPFEKIRIAFLRAMESKNKIEDVVVEQNNEQIGYGYKESIDVAKEVEPVEDVEQVGCGYKESIDVVKEAEVVEDIDISSSTDKVVEDIGFEKSNGEIELNNEVDNKELEVDITPDMII